MLAVRNKTDTEKSRERTSNLAKMNSNSNALNPQQQLLDPQMGDLSHPNPPQFQSQPHPQPHPHPQPQQRRPRGFAATAAAAAMGGGTTMSASTPAAASAGGGKGRREREKEKERTKLRERHRRAITSRMLAGLRQYGNFPLPARADMNDVLAALAREAGWIVEADGTTYRPSSPPAQMAAFSVRSVESPLSASSLKNCSTKGSLDYQQSVLGMDESLSPASFDSVVVTDSETKSKKHASASASPKCLEAHQLMQDVQSGESNFTGTPYVPVYVVLASGILNNYCQLVDPEGLRMELKHLKSLNVDGVIVECWWGIVEGWSPQKYVWSGYRELFLIVQQFQLKIQVVMAFHEYSGGDSGDVLISLPQWVLEIGKDNQDIFFTDREGRRNTECLSWGIDKERVLRGRTGIEAYFDFMRSFRTEFDDLFAEGVISGVEIGLGASGELKFPSCSERMGWKYPGVGEFQNGNHRLIGSVYKKKCRHVSNTRIYDAAFIYSHIFTSQIWTQCYDRYLQQNLRKAAKLRGHSFWARGPDNAGQYKSKSIETGFFCDQGDYDSYYGRFFLRWYTQILVDHADNVLSLASLAFEETQISVKIPAIYWWYKTASHAAELTAGYYNPMNRDGYSPIFEVLKKHSVAMKFVCPGFHVHCQEFDEALADPEGLSWQVLNGAWDQGLTIGGQNAYPCYDREEHMRLVETSKPRNDPDRRRFAFFVYQLSGPIVQRTYCFSELDHFVKSMHGDVVCDPES